MVSMYFSAAADLSDGRCWRIARAQSLGIGDVGRVQKVLGWRAATPIEVGIWQTVTWYKATLAGDRSAV
jgi:nucleoside-diphosphate-sugar epimerase